MSQDYTWCIFIYTYGDTPIEDIDSDTIYPTMEEALEDAEKVVWIGCRAVVKVYCNGKAVYRGDL
jgi:hypothetical protein